MDYIKDNILLKYLNGEIESSVNNNILVLNDEIFKVCKGKVLLNKNELTLIVGGKGSGKSKFMYHLIKQILSEETDEEFEASLKLIDDYKFRVVNINQFYLRPGTPAANLKQLPTKVVKSRSSKLTELFKSYQKHSYMIGGEERVWINEI